MIVHTHPMFFIYDEGRFPHAPIGNILLVGDSVRGRATATRIVCDDSGRAEAHALSVEKWVRDVSRPNL